MLDVARLESLGKARVPIGSLEIKHARRLQGPQHLFRRNEPAKRFIAFARDNAWVRKWGHEQEHIFGALREAFREMSPDGYAAFAHLPRMQKRSELAWAPRKKWCRNGMLRDAFREEVAEVVRVCF
jgi:hypothetical protein